MVTGRPSSAESARSEVEALLCDQPELGAALLCLLAYALLFLAVFGLAELSGARHLPRYSLCISEYSS